MPSKVVYISGARKQSLTADDFKAEFIRLCDGAEDLFPKELLLDHRPIVETILELLQELKNRRELQIVKRLGRGHMIDEEQAKVALARLTRTPLTEAEQKQFKIILRLRTEVLELSGDPMQQPATETLAALRSVWAMKRPL